MNNKANEISAGQVFIFMISAQVGFSILSLSSTLAQKMGHDGWISLVFTGIITFGLIYLVMLCMKRYKNKSIIEINNLIWGKYLGMIMNIFVIAYLVFTTVLSIRIFNDVIKLSALKYTPSFVLSSFIILPIVYLSWYGLKYICRFSVINMIIYVVVILYYLLLSKYYRLSFMQPIGQAGLEVVLKNSYTPFVSFLGYELLSVIYPCIKNKKAALKYAMYGNLVSLLFYVITVVFTTGFFGEEMLKQLQYPIFSLARAYRAPVLERLDLFFISLWFPIMLTSVQLYYFCAYHCLKKLLKIEDNRKKRKYLLFGFTLLVLICSRIPQTATQVNSLLEWLGYLGTAYISYVIVCYLISFFILGGNNHETST